MQIKVNESFAISQIDPVNSSFKLRSHRIKSSAVRAAQSDQSMAAYAALLTLNFTIDQHHQRSIVFPVQYPIPSVKETISFLLRMLEDCDYQMIQQEIVELEREIAEAAYDVDFVIECLTVVPVAVKYGYNRSILFCEEDMVQIMKKFVSIMEKAMKVMDVKVTSQRQLPLPGRFAHSAPSISVNPGGILYERMVGFKEQQKRVLNEISNTWDYKLHILPVVGIGGSGKTTLIRSVFDHEDTKEKFGIRMWSTISQSPDLQSVLSSFLQDVGIVDWHKNPGEQLHKRLKDKRYLIVLDDIWGTDVWDTIRSFFPDNGHSNWIIITTRLSNVASYIGTHPPYELSFLTEVESWDLLREKVFGQDGWPPKLVHLGMDICRHCRGLPLVIVVMAGLLSKTEMTIASWKDVKRRMRSAIGSKGEDWCLQVLSFCYESLPVYLKPCFLYMGVFPEDHSIEVSVLIKMWGAEGFLKPNGDQCLEDVAMEYLVDLVQRNLILVAERSSSGNIENLQIHDFLRDLCLKKGYEYNFLRSRTYFNLGILPGAEINYPLYLLPHSREVHRSISLRIGK